MSASDRLARIKIKTDRANSLARELVSRILAFYEPEPFKVITEDDSDTGDRVFRVKVAREIPLEISATIGDVIHNLRSALDHLANHLVSANGGTPTKDTCYPIYETIMDYQSRRQSRVNGMSIAAIDKIDQTQPYKGGNDDLWRLHKLDIIDKHKLLLTVGGCCRVIALDFNALVRSQNPDMCNIVLPTIPLSTQNQGIVTDGVEIHRVPAFATNPDIHTIPQFPPSIAINEPPMCDVEDILPLLKRLFQLVDGIIDQLTPHL